MEHGTIDPLHSPHWSGFCNDRDEIRQSNSRKLFGGDADAMVTVGKIHFIWEEKQVWQGGELIITALKHPGIRLA